MKLNAAKTGRFINEPPRYSEAFIKSYKEAFNGKQTDEENAYQQRDFQQFKRVLVVALVIFALAAILTIIEKG
jgi:hypothetical protein